MRPEDCSAEPWSTGGGDAFGVRGPRPDRSAFLDAFDEGVILLTGTRRIRGLNSAAERLLGWSSAELEGAFLSRIVVASTFPLAELPGWQRHLTTRERKLAARPVGVTLRNRGGEEFSAGLVATVLPLDGGEELLMAVLRDERDRAELDRQVGVTGYLRAAARGCSRLTGHNDLNSLANAVVALLTSELELDFVRLWLRDEDTDLLRPVVSDGRFTLPAGAFPSPLHAWKTRGGLPRPDAFAPLIQSDLADRAQLECDWLREHPRACRVLLPLVGGCALKGVLECFAANRPGEETLDVLATLAATTASSVHALQLVQREAEALGRVVAIVESSDDAVVGTDLEGTIITWNPGAERVYGYTAAEVLGRSVTLVAPPDRPEEIPELLRQLQQGQRVTHFETRRRRKDGEIIDISLTLSPIRDCRGVVTGISAIARDMTEQKRLEEQLRQSQKMEAVGRLAGGVAHDFNNMLAVISGYTELLITRTAEDDASRRALEEIGKASERAISLTRQLLAYSRKQVLAPRLLDLGEIVTGLEGMLRRLIGEDIELRTEVDVRLGQIKADPTRIEQVVMNLVVNARDAMPGGGKLTIRAANADIDERYARRHPEVAAGEYVALTVEDTGCGIAPELLPHIFEPFYTTKDVGQGTGLGLATVYGIVTQSGGSIEVDSVPGRGTTFRIYLPRVETPVSERASEAAAPVLPGCETLLLVEDEPMVRTLVRNVLEEVGYRVLEAGTPASALKIAGDPQHRIDMLLTDVVMPEMSGPELLKHLAPHHPGLKVLFMSGHTEEAVKRHGVLAPGTAFIEKPFSPATLARTVRSILG